ncbi:Protein cramped-like protein [Thelohanellus kitauei]|uniref:Protein cramped-like protein n=1 Tax=Thelohanellus kitauei TaxID=669202 RepID=A0A0C2MTN8_THEKT|nr:Protein cramped-like protein [Thelohanellus kitauei]
MKTSKSDNAEEDSSLEDKIEVVTKVKKKKESKLIKSTDKHWSEENIKLFFDGLKIYGKDYARIHEYIGQHSNSFDKPIVSVRFFFNRILQRVTRYVKKYIQDKEDQLKQRDIDKIYEMVDNESTRSNYDHLCLVLAFGELYFAGLLPPRPDNRHLKKLVDLLIKGRLTLLKNREKITIQIPDFDSIEPISRDFRHHAVTSDEAKQVDDVAPPRMEINLNPKTLALLLLMKQRAFAPKLRIDIPVFCRVRDIIAKLVNYWRLPIMLIKDNMNLYHSTENTDTQNNKSTMVRLLLDTELFSDLKPRVNNSVNILYELNLEKLPTFDDGALAVMTLHMIPKLAKIQLGVHPLVPTFKKPLPPRPIVDGKPAFQVQQTIPVSKKVKKHVSRGDQEPLAPQFDAVEKRRITTSMLSTPMQDKHKITPNAPLCSPPSYDLKLFGLGTLPDHNEHFQSFVNDETTRDTHLTLNINPNSNFEYQPGFEDSFDQKNITLNQTDISSNQGTFFQDNIPNFDNDESNLGFLAHFGFWNSKERRVDTNVHHTIPPSQTEDSHHTLPRVATDILETPNFANIKEKDNKTSQAFGRRLFFDDDDSASNF